MRPELRASLVAIVALTLVLGLAYPLAMTGASQVLFGGAADGSRIAHGGREVGSRLIAQPFLRGEKPDPRYFQPRPSVTGYAAAATRFNNLGPNQRDLAGLLGANADAYLVLEGSDNPGLEKADIPPDAVTTSASGVDPHISPENARIQSARVARVRGLSRVRVLELVDEHTDGRFLGFMGDPGINVLELNIALDEEAR